MFRPSFICGLAPPVAFSASQHFEATDLPLLTRDSVSIVVYILEEKTAGATRGRSPIDLDVGASPRRALHNCVGAAGYELCFLLINNL